MSSTQPGKSLAPRKRSRTDNDAVNDDAKKSKFGAGPLELTDVNDYCLAKIFKFLNLQDLINIAETDDRFINAANLAFSSKYCQTNKKTMLGIGGQLLSLRRSDCVGPDYCEAFFRYFGHLTPYLAINFARFNEDVDILKYLNENCTDSLIRLTLFGNSYRNFGAIDAVFPNVLGLKIFAVHLDERMSQLSTWFPNLKRLELSCTSSTHPKLIEANFPNLLQLLIDENSCLPDSTLVELIRLNPQLRELMLGSDYDVSFLQSISQSLPQLEKLKLWTPEFHFERFTGPPVVFETVKNFELELPNWIDPFDRDPILNVPFRFTNLDKLTITDFGRLDHLLPFVHECTSIVELTLIGCLPRLDYDYRGEISTHELSDVMNNIPNLVELRFCVDEIVMEYDLEDGIEVEDIGDDVEDENEDGDDVEDDNEDANEANALLLNADMPNQMEDVEVEVTELLRANTTLKKIHLMFPNADERSEYRDIIENRPLTRFKVFSGGCDSCTEDYRPYYCLLLERNNHSSLSYNDTH